MPCDGLYYRVETTEFFHKSGSGIYESKIRLEPLKSLSCSGCAVCQALIDKVEEIGITNIREAFVGRWYKMLLDGDKVSIIEVPRLNRKTGKERKVWSRTAEV